MTVSKCIPSNATQLLADAITLTPSTSSQQTTPVCHMPAASWLLAQASIAATHPALRPHSTNLTLSGKKLCNAIGNPIVVGPGLDGSISKQTGFLPAYPMATKLPSEYSEYEDVCDQLPNLLRTYQVRQAIHALPPKNFKSLCDSFLSRAAIVLSSLAHAFYFHHRKHGKPDTVPLPEALRESWRLVGMRLQRLIPAVRVPADDIFNNVVVNANGQLLPLTLEYFRIPEERLSSGLQGSLEARFASCLEAMCQAQWSIATADDSTLANLLSEMSGHLIACGKLINNMSPQIFDAIIWGRTYPEMGRPLVADELSNSGVDAPMFHALDAFLGRIREKSSDLEEQQRRRVKAFPVTHQALLNALADPRYNIRNYVNHSSDPGPKYAFEVLMQTYAWLLERHRQKAIGAIGVVLAGGRVSTAGGANQKMVNTHTFLPVDEIINIQMKEAAEHRTAGCSTTVQACVVGAQVITPKALRITLSFTTPVPMRAGDRVYVWPENTDQAIQSFLDPLAIPPIEERTQSLSYPQMTNKPQSMNDLDSTDVPATALNHDSSKHVELCESMRKLDLEQLDKIKGSISAPLSLLGYLKACSMLAPRAYSVADVEPRGEDLASIINLTVAFSDTHRGPSVSYLRSLSPGAKIKIGLNPSPRFHLPADPLLPVVLIGQGVGVGPLFGFLKDRARLAQRGQVEQGSLFLFATAQRAVEVPYIEQFIQLTEYLPLSLTLALTKERGQSITAGKVNEHPTNLRISDALALESNSLRDCLLRGGHFYVCGGVDFGLGVRSFMESLLRRHLTIAQGIEVMIWKYHEDLFSIPNQQDNVFQFTAQELAKHNQLNNLWSSINGFVYDLTSYVQTHPGGSKVLMEVAGLVGDRRFKQIHGGLQAQEITARMNPYKIGRLFYSPLLEAEGGSRQLYNLLEKIVKAENILRNNTTFPLGRDTPFYFTSEALLVMAEISLPQISDCLPPCQVIDSCSKQLVKRLQDFKERAIDYLRINGIVAEQTVLENQQFLINVFISMLDQFKLKVGEFLDQLASGSSAQEEVPTMLDAIVAYLGDAIRSCHVYIDDAIKKF